MLTIDGSPVSRGDRLFSLRAGVFGTVTLLNENSAVLTVQLESGSRELVIARGGFVAGRRDASWHAPLALSLPKGSEAKLAKIQAIVDKMNEVL